MGSEFGTPLPVIPAKAGIHPAVGPGFRRNDEYTAIMHRLSEGGRHRATLLIEVTSLFYRQSCGRYTELVVVFSSPSALLRIDSETEKSPPKVRPFTSFRVTLPFLG